MKIEVYQPITVEYDYPDRHQTDLVVYMGEVEVHRKRDVAPLTMWCDENYETNEKNAVVGEFARRLLKVLPE